MDAAAQERNRKAKRRERNRRDYERSRAEQDQLLLRLDRGDLAQLDAASTAVGLSRAAFVRMFMAPTLGALASRFGDIDRARTSRRQSLAQFLGAAIDAALRDAPGSVPVPVPVSASADECLAAADEFDCLFGAADEGA
jgi:hypothetical protein